MATCKQCKAVVPEQKAFCPECGTPTAQQSAERSAPPPDLGATVLVPPSKWPNMPPTDAAQPPNPKAPPVAQPTAAPSSPPPAARPAPAAPRMEAPPPTASPAVAPTKSSNWLVFLLGGAVVLLLVLLAFLLLNRG
jgi:hypothetical protein